MKPSSSIISASRYPATGPDFDFGLAMQSIFYPFGVDKMSINHVWKLNTKRVRLTT